jgi:hemin uptake protein HemP
MVKPRSHHYQPTAPRQQAMSVTPNRDVYPPKSILSVTSHTLFAGADELEITHQGAQYRLRQTALGKLILTK